MFATPPTQPQKSLAEIRAEIEQRRAVLEAKQRALGLEAFNVVPTTHATTSNYPSSTSGAIGSSGPSITQFAAPIGQSSLFPAAQPSFQNFSPTANTFSAQDTPPPVVAHRQPTGTGFQIGADSMTQKEIAHRKRQEYSQQLREQMEQNQQFSQNQHHQQRHHRGGNAPSEAVAAGAFGSKSNAYGAGLRLLGVNGGSGDANSDETRSKKAAYAAELRNQMAEKEQREKREKEEREAFELRHMRKAHASDPEPAPLPSRRNINQQQQQGRDIFGGIKMGGAGDPVRSSQNNAFQQQQPAHNSRQPASADLSLSPSGGQQYSPTKITKMTEGVDSVGIFGGRRRGGAGDPVNADAYMDPVQRRRKLQADLARQLDEQRQRKQEQKQREKDEERRLEEKIAREQAEIRDRHHQKRPSNVDPEQPQKSGGLMQHSPTHHHHRRPQSPERLKVADHAPHLPSTTYAPDFSGRVARPMSASGSRPHNQPTTQGVVYRAPSPLAFAPLQRPDTAMTAGSMGLGSVGRDLDQMKDQFASEQINRQLEQQNAEMDRLRNEVSLYQSEHQRTRHQLDVLANQFQQQSLNHHPTAHNPMPSASHPRTHVSPSFGAPYPGEAPQHHYNSSQHQSQQHQQIHQTHQTHQNQHLRQRPPPHSQQPMYGRSPALPAHDDPSEVSMIGGSELVDFGQTQSSFRAVPQDQLSPFSASVEVGHASVDTRQSQQQMPPRRANPMYASLAGDSKLVFPEDEDFGDETLSQVPDDQIPSPEPQQEEYAKHSDDEYGEDSFDDDLAEPQTIVQTENINGFEVNTLIKSQESLGSNRGSRPSSANNRKSQTETEQHSSHVPKSPEHTESPVSTQEPFFLTEVLGENPFGAQARVRRSRPSSTRRRTPFSSSVSKSAQELDRASVSRSSNIGGVRISPRKSAKTFDFAAAQPQSQSLSQPHQEFDFSDPLAQLQSLFENLNSDSNSPIPINTGGQTSTAAPAGAFDSSGDLESFAPT